MLVVLSLSKDFYLSPLTCFELQLLQNKFFHLFWKAMTVDLFKVRPAFHFKSSLRCGLFIPIRFKIERLLLLLKVKWHDSEIPLLVGICNPDLSTLDL